LFVKEQLHQPDQCEGTEYAAGYNLDNNNAVVPCL